MAAEHSLQVRVTSLLAPLLALLASFRAESDIERVWSEWTTGVVCRQDLDISAALYAVCLVCVSS